MKNKARIVYRTAFSLILIFSFSIFLYLVVISVQRLLRYETSISLDVKSTAETEFPTFTICPTYEDAYKSEILSKYDSDTWKIRNLVFPSNVNMSAIEFFEMVTYSVDEIVTSMKIKIGDNGQVQDDKSKSDIMVYPNATEWINQTYILFGRCYTYTIPDEYIESKVNLKVI